MKNLVFALLLTVAPAAAQVDLEPADVKMDTVVDGERKAIVDLRDDPRLTSRMTPLGGVVTDSIVWTLVYLDYAGDEKCRHQFVEGDEGIAYPEAGCPDAGGLLHCSWHDRVKFQICRICYRREGWREFWYQRVLPPPEKAEYEILKDTVIELKKRGK